MRNAFLTKTLLCGVMATTFFLINCQKAPSRGVKAQQGGGSVNADSAAEKAKQEILVACSDDFLPKYLKAKAEVDKLAAKAEKNLADLTEAEKEEIRSEEKSARALIDDAVAEITSINAEATGCTKAGEATPYLIVNIKGLLAKVNLKLAEKNVETEGLKEAQSLKAERKKELVEKNAKSLAEDMEFYISDELAEELSKNKVGAVYFQSTQIVKNYSTETYNAVKKDKKMSMCELGHGTLAETVEKGQKGKVTLVELGTSKDIANRHTLKVIMVVPSKTEQSNFVEFDCLIANDRRAQFGVEFRNVFGIKHLATEENRVNETKKAEANKVTLEEAKNNLKQRDADLVAKTTALERAKAELAAKEVEMQKAADAKEADKLKTLEEEKAKLVEHVAEVEKQQKRAQELKTEAEEALKKAEAEAVKV